MITNERQYKITKSQIAKFRTAINQMAVTPAAGVETHPRLVQAEREAMESQLADLEEEIAEYEELKSSHAPVISIDSFDQLAVGLIKARIASGLSQRALAERLGMKEQQIQRYEAERYDSASLLRLREVATALGVRIRNDILLPMAPGDFRALANKVQQAGLDRDFFFRRLLPSADAARITGEISNAGDGPVMAKAVAVLERVFGWTKEALASSQPLGPPRLAADSARFKMPKGRRKQPTTLYTTYANYLAAVAASGSRELTAKSIPQSADGMRHDLIAAYSSVELKTALHFAWDMGVTVLPLNDPGAFHGACWRIKGRNVIVLKQTSRHQARWLFDLLHELFHTAQMPEADSLEIIESDEMSAERRESNEEIAASQYAGDVCLNGRAEQISQACVVAAKGSVERLKAVVPAIAADYDVTVGVLANYLAFRLSWQGINWWGVAANLQQDDNDPWIIARDVFIERFPFKFDDAVDRQLLERALH